MEYLQRVSRFEDLARTYWVDALIALLAIAGMLELVVARDSPSDPPTDLWLSVLLLAVLVAPIFARRRFPFGGPLAYWVLAPAITFYDGELIPFIGSLGVVGLATAFMLGNLRNGLKAGIGLAVVTVGIVDGRLQHPRHDDDQQLRLHHAPVRRGLARRLRPA